MTGQVMAETMGSVAGEAGAASRIRSARSGWGKKVGGWIKGPLIALAGLLGVLAVALTVLPVFGWNTVVLASGSMSPTYPAGSVLLGQDVPATQVRVGDIVTVQRPGQVPVTHRVIGIQDSIAGAATLRLQGDANATEDPRPYTVERVGLVAGGIPWGGQVLTGIRSPWALGALTIAVAALVLWSWWPRQQNGQEQTMQEQDMQPQGVSSHAQNS
jgi:signal peptidase